MQSCSESIALGIRFLTSTGDGRSEAGEEAERKEEEGIAGEEWGLRADIEREGRVVNKYKLKILIKNIKRIKEKSRRKRCYWLREIHVGSILLVAIHLPFGNSLPSLFSLTEFR
ncbi:hypothetical protein CRG98_025377 [Punica granatum]|uniref:Uncharacterized protein n=1 Tax=Punica granatum TaxID=22663 RepID=A0A2I0JDY5_PUNGR|nr:hypothetical protein CRG98_025377 [Punica granatum]